MLRKLGFEPKLGFVQERPGVRQKGVALIIGREAGEGSFVGVDFLLPVQPWIATSVARAQLNLVDYAFAKLPTITPEDLIIAKLFALASEPGRPNDKDDIQSILKNDLALDFKYIEKSITALDLKIPADVKLG